MSYSADTFVADEQPTTAKWNKLWSNDASFNDGTGIADNVIIPRHLDLDGGTDANGWREIDFGGRLVYTKTWSDLAAASVAAHGQTALASTQSLPVGIAPVDYLFLYSHVGDVDSTHQYFVSPSSLNIDSSGTTEQFNISIRNLTTSTLSWTGIEFYMTLIEK